VLKDTTVRWKLDYAEPHSVSMFVGAEPAGEPPETPSGARFPDSPIVHSGLIFGGNPQDPPTYDVTFTTAGTYGYFCVIHPYMTGTVRVLEPGSAGAGGVDNQQSVDARGAADANSYMLALQDADKALKAVPTTVIPKPGGARQHTVVLGGLADAGTLNVNYPAKLTIRPGDSVLFRNNVPVPHTATFGNPPPGDPFALPPTKDGGTYDGSGLVNSGILETFFDGTPSTSTFEVVFPKAGTYKYICTVHADQGQGGEIIVQAGAPLPPNTGAGIAAPGRDAGWYLVGAALVLFATVAGGAAIAARGS
jgi:plastocyanin